MNRSPHDAQPDAATLRQYLEDNGPIAPRSRRLILWLVIAALGLLLLLGGEHPLLLIAPWAVLFGFAGWLLYRRHILSRARNGVREVRELTMLRQSDRAADLAWRLIPQVRNWPEFHAQTIIMLGENYMQLGAWEPAVGVYDFLIERIGEDGPMTTVLRGQRLIGLLHEDRLADADRELRAIAPHADAPLPGALYRAGELYRQLKTHHDPAALAANDRDELHEALRPLGVEAGGYYALMAVACQRAGEQDRAARWWRDATLLQSPVHIAAHLPEVAPLLEPDGPPPAPTLAQVMAEDAAA